MLSDLAVPCTWVGSEGWGDVCEILLSSAFYSHFVSQDMVGKGWAHTTNDRRAAFRRAIGPDEARLVDGLPSGVPFGPLQRPIHRLW